ncbi:uncharacterized protein F4817DRAFT_316355 [Daldinia loculata]|uniref:uncharacterized protein n=1 Tax=Daldinia loculata TaxID=103429 RepID=UPI0020C45CF3|nr:uncharacterized protein F4817DRAFT_316355 [Daldinia loculata]KAI1646953.1 hypothetical protein F4817DRAFT_316355 [Daldinia loculata]
MGIVAALLGNGADPNFVAKDESPSIWVWTLTFALNAYQNEADKLDMWMNVLRLMVTNGASTKKNVIEKALDAAMIRTSNLKTLGRDFARKSIQGTLQSMMNHSGPLEERFRFDGRIWGNS